MKKFYSDKKTITEHICVMTILLAALVLSCFRVHDGHGWGDDFAEYICQGLSLIDNSQEKTIEVMEVMCSKSLPVLGPGNYPWGYPLLLLPILRLFGVNFIALKAINIVSV